jgi:hypothetical protein
MLTSSSRAFQRHQEHNLKHPRFVDLITTKQNKTNSLSFIDRYPLEMNKSQFLKMALDPVIQKVITRYMTLKLYLYKPEMYMQKTGSNIRCGISKSTPPTTCCSPLSFMKDMVIVQPWFQHLQDSGCNSTRITSVGQFLLFQRKNWQIKGEVPI